ncbi:hypothetical protein [Pseudooctadecabacter jejudonensis]|uniref:Uncharacterized protein n=1 Tax=Pseudooctadecabacter jejudonensis TaxID=1391910 RepID=A0A1Y5SY16_9RHOB|nr:hypothetical protein [Pseudooctadecabacter jejudonensis]SLN50521.1 hypothetical protein PSJ8397_02637 [Pseudooctadecabacter jejudonensis]
MQNLFYIPPHHPQDSHPRPLGVRSVVKRNSPTRLDLAAPHTALDMGLVTHGDIAPEPVLAPVYTVPSRTGLRTKLGRWIVRFGEKIAGETAPPLGQPV